MARITTVLLLSLISASTAQIFSLSDTCTKLFFDKKTEIDLPLALDYEGEQFQYYSTLCSTLRPACILSPKDATEVAYVLDVLRKNEDNFALKSGGHNPNQYFSSISGGPLISTRRMNGVTLDAAAQTVRVGPGARWDDVSAALDGTGFAAVGGRLGDVGVGGYLPLGGISFLSSQHGWAVNSVLEMEVVLANGTTVIASKTQNKDLFDVLHGGGNQFGIITSYLLEAHPISKQIYGGTMTFSGDQAQAVLSAAGKFARDYENHPKAAVIINALRPLPGVEMWLMYFFFDGTDPGTIFADFDAIPHLLDDRKVRTYHDYLTANNAGIVKGLVWTIAGEYSPLPDAANNDQVLNSYADHWRSVGDSISGTVGLIQSMAIQPVPRSLARAAKARGGDLYNIDDTQDHLIVEYTYAYLAVGIDDAKVDNAIVRLLDGLKDLVANYVANGTLRQNAPYPVFGNDGYHRQDFWGRLAPEKREFAKNVKRSVDPDGFFTKRTGGWTLEA